MSNDDSASERKRLTADALARAAVAAPAARAAPLREVVRLNLTVARDVTRRFRGRGVAQRTSSRSPISAWCSLPDGSTRPRRPTSSASQSPRSGGSCAATSATRAGWCVRRGRSRRCDPGCRWRTPSWARSSAVRRRAARRPSGSAYLCSASRVVGGQVRSPPHRWTRPRPTRRRSERLASEERGVRRRRGPRDRPRADRAQPPARRLSTRFCRDRSQAEIGRDTGVTQSRSRAS